MREDRSDAVSSRFAGFRNVFLLSFLLFSLGTIGVEIVRIDVRFAVFVQDLTKYPLTVFPTINGVPYPDYPAAMTLIAWLFSAGGRFLNQWTLSLFSMLCGSLTIALVWMTGESMKKGTGVIAASILFMTLEFNSTIMGFGIDVPVMAAGALILCLLSAGSRRSPDLLFPVLLVFCFLIRGPMGIVLLGAAAGGWILFARQWKRVLTWGIAGAVTLAVCMGGGYLLIQAAGGRELFDQFLSWQVTSRMEADDLFFYVLDGPVVFSPSTAAAIATLLTVASVRRVRRSGTVLLPLFGFLLFPLILLSIPGCKHLRYMMITIPAFALIGAWGIRMSFAFPRCRRILRAVFRILAAYGWIAALCAALAVTIGAAAMAKVFDPILFFRCALLALFPAAGLLFRKKKGFLRDIFRTGIVLGILGAVFIFPATTCRELSEKFVRSAECHRTGRLYFYRIGVDHEDLKYLRFLSPEDRADTLYLGPVSNPKNKYSRMYRQIGFEGFADMKPGDILVARSRDAEQLEKDAAPYGRKAVFLVKGKLGHKEYSAFEIRPADGTK